MMILITVLLGLSIGGVWWYARRRVVAHPRRAAGRPARAETTSVQEPMTVPTAQGASVSRAPSLQSELRDSLLATEVVELGIDDQLASYLQEGALDRAIFLLKQFIQACPRDEGHRMRLFSLLYTERRRDDFINEAMDAKRLTPPLSARVWLQICKWGSELDPGNDLFMAPAPHAAVQGAVREVKKNGDSQTANIPPRRAQSSVSYPGLERRKGADRRVSISPWLGEERRSTDRRRKVQPIKAKAMPQTPNLDGESSASERSRGADTTQGKLANA